MKMATIDELVSKYPRLFHMAESGTWERIQEHGLLSTTALLDLFEVEEPKRSRIESKWRRQSESIAPGVVIRDQKPMSPRSLENVLEDMTPEQWYRLLNRKTFFGTTLDRLKKMLKAGSYKNDHHDVLTVDTRMLVERHRDHISLSHINSGATFGYAKRGSGTFKGIEAYPAVRRKTDVAEVVVEYYVPDVVDFTLSVERWKGNVCLKTIWKPDGVDS